MKKKKARKLKKFRTLLRKYGRSNFGLDIAVTRNEFIFYFDDNRQTYANATSPGTPLVTNPRGRKLNLKKKYTHIKRFKGVG